jgi:hypothetical protein
MRPALRLFAALAVTIPCFVLATPAWSGDYLPQVGCDTLATPGHTDYEFLIWKHNYLELCRTELRPFARDNVPRTPIESWVMPEGWTAEWIPGEPGAIVIRGCLVGINQEFSPPLHIVMPGEAGFLEARFFDQAGMLLRPFTTLYWCGSVPVPALPATWGQIKSQYR